MDEPLSILMPNCGYRPGPDQSIFSMLKVTTIYVTHDQIEAMTLADRVVVMNKGLIQQIGTPNRNL